MNNIVLIADCVDKNRKISLESADLECIDTAYFNEIYDGLKKIALKVTHYNNPEDFLNHIALHKNDIVLSIWSGQLSRNRKALVPSICEAYGIKYVGADPYIHLISQDKQLTKHICSKYNIYGSPDFLIENINDLTPDLPLNYPVVVKPNQEGGSNGISEKSVAFGYDEVFKLTQHLLEHFHQPILIEEYICGHEICVTIAGKNGKIDVLEADEIIVDTPSENPYPMFGYESKKAKTVSWHRVPATNLLTSDMINNFTNLFHALGKVDVLRIDGKISGNNFTLLELTPDTHLGSKASTAYAFELAGYNHQDMLNILLHYAME